MPTNVTNLLELHRTLDRLCFEYAAALRRTGLAVDLRAGKIIGTAALFSIRARQPAGAAGAGPFDGELDEPAPGSSAVTAKVPPVDPDKPWKRALGGADRSRTTFFPLTLSMLMFDSSGPTRRARQEHLRCPGGGGGRRRLARRRPDGRHVRWTGCSTTG